MADYVAPIQLTGLEVPREPGTESQGFTVGTLAQVMTVWAAIVASTGSLQVQPFHRLACLALLVKHKQLLSKTRTRTETRKSCS